MCPSCENKKSHWLRGGVAAMCNVDDLYDDKFFNDLGVFGQAELVEKIRNGYSG